METYVDFECHQSGCDRTPPKIHLGRGPLASECQEQWRRPRLVKVESSLCSLLILGTLYHVSLFSFSIAFSHLEGGPWDEMDPTGVKWPKKNR